MKIGTLDKIPDEPPKDHFLSTLSAPARRALEKNGISTLEQLSNYSKKEVLKFHGMGKSSIPKLLSSLEKENLDFKKEYE